MAGDGNLEGAGDEVRTHPLHLRRATERRTSLSPACPGCVLFVRVGYAWGVLGGWCRRPCDACPACHRADQELTAQCWARQGASRAEAAWCWGGQCWASKAAAPSAPPIERPVGIFEHPNKCPPCPPCLPCCRSCPTSSYLVLPHPTSSLIFQNNTTRTHPPLCCRSCPTSCARLS